MAPYSGLISYDEAERVKKYLNPETTLVRFQNGSLLIAIHPGNRFVSFTTKNSANVLSFMLVT